MPSANISELLPESRIFPPSDAFAAQANVQAVEYARADADPVGWWEEQARRLEWAEPWHTAHRFTPALRADGSLQPPDISWFEGGRLNVAVNCVDRHVAAGLGERVAFHFEGEPGDRRSLTYSDLQRDVSRAANALESLGVGVGDRVVVYLPVLLETVVVTLAIARIGAVHSLVFGGFSAEALRYRVADTEAKLVVTTDGQFRRGRAVPVKSAVDEAVAGLDHVEHVLVIRRTGDAVVMTPGRDVWWHDDVDGAADVHDAQAFDAEHPLFVIYTSGTTGRPKGVVHTSGGYLVQASWTHWALFDAKPDDVYWCTADLAWVTAHTYALYGPLSNAATSVLYEGTPDTPRHTRHFEIIQRYGVTTYYTAPTLIRTLATWYPDGPPGAFDLSSIRLLGTVGESINPAAWMWFREHLGGGSAPIVNTWWQSETGAAIVAPLPGVSTLKPGSATRALPGLRVRVLDEAGDEVEAGEGGLLVIDGTWPAMARTLWRDAPRFLSAYWARFAAQGAYVAGDGARKDADGDLVVLGRIDEVINVSGHRLSTIEIESALVAHAAVGEAAVTGVTDSRTGEAITAFVVLKGDATGDLHEELRTHVATVIGPIAKPQRVHLVDDLPKTRSGKIMRRLLRDLVDGRPLGDTTSLQDPDVVTRLAAQLASLPAHGGS
jgi:acetyl-CoA synthetase